MMWFFHRLVRMVSIRDYHDFEALYMMVHKSQVKEGEAETDIPRLLVEWASRRENRKLLKELTVDDTSREYVETDGCASFGSLTEPDRLAVARKLTLMSEMNKRFVVDRWLWQ